MKRAVAMLVSTLAVSACESGSAVADVEPLFGCYSYQGTPVLYVERDKVANPRGPADDFTEVVGFRTIKGAELIVTRNPISFDSERGVRFGRSNTGYFNEVRREARAVVLLVFLADTDRQIELAKTGATC